MPSAETLQEARPRGGGGRGDCRHIVTHRPNEQSNMQFSSTAREGRTRQTDTDRQTEDRQPDRDRTDRDRGRDRHAERQTDTQTDRHGRKANILKLQEVLAPLLVWVGLEGQCQSVYIQACIP